MKTALTAMLLIIAQVVTARGESSQNDLPSYEVADATLPPVTAENILELDRLWPYAVTLGKDVETGTAKRLRVGSRGVLIRMNEDRSARIDFGRDGLLDVPVASTDILEIANSMRIGTVRKSAPNIPWAFSNKLVGLGPNPKTYPLTETSAKAGFVFAIGHSANPGFKQLVSNLTTVDGRNGVMVVLLPLGSENLQELLDDLESTGWTGAFVPGYLAGPLARTLIGEAPEKPVLLFTSPDGRVLWQGLTNGALPADLEEALARTFARNP